MKLNFKITQKNIFLAVYLLILVINFALVFYVFRFIYEDVYKIIYMDENYLSSQSNFKSVDININKFDSVKEFMEEKERPNKINGPNNVFN